MTTPGDISRTLGNLASRLVEDGSISDGERDDLVIGQKMLGFMAVHRDALRLLMQHLRKFGPGEPPAPETALTDPRASLIDDPAVCALLAAFPDAELIVGNEREAVA